MAAPPEQSSAGNRRYQLHDIPILQRTLVGTVQDDLVVHRKVEQRIVNLLRESGDTSIELGDQFTDGRDRDVDRDRVLRCELQARWKADADHANHREASIASSS